MQVTGKFKADVSLDVKCSKKHTIFKMSSNEK